MASSFDNNLPVEHSVKAPRRLGAIAWLAVLAALVAAGANVESLRKVLESRPWRPFEDDGSVAERRYAPLAEALPERGSVGFVTSPDRQGRARVTILRRLQYALAPRIVVDSVDAPFVVMDFAGDPLPAGPPPAGYRLVQDYGDGLCLYRHEAATGEATRRDSP